MAYKTFNRFLKSLSIKKKLTYTLIPVILVTYLLSVGSVYMVSFHETKSIVNQQAQTLANQRTQLVDSYLDQLRTETEIFMFDTAFQKRFRTNRSTLSLSQQEELNKEITQYMYSMIISYNVYVESITLINNHLDSYNWHMDGRNSYSAYISRLLPLSDTLTELDGGILYTYDKLDQGVVTIARLIKDPIYDRKIGIFMLDFNLGFLNKMTGVRTKDQSTADALLAIADIRMPIMSGLELATHIHTHYPQIKVILVTGYSDFEYARTAIQNNVFEYLLKPIDSENLIAVILRAQKEIESAEKNERLFKVFKEHFSDNLQSARRQFVENLLFRSGVFQNADDLREAYGFNFKTYRLVSVCCRTAMDAAQLESEYYCTHLVDEYMQEAQPGIITYIFGNLVFMLWNVEKPNPYDDNEALLGFLRDLHAKARRNFLGMLSAGISQASSTLNNIQTLRHQTSECLEYMQENKKQEFLFYEDILNDTIHWEIEPQIETLTACVHAGNTAGALRYFDQMRADIQEKQPDTVYSVFLLIVSKVCLVMREYRSESYALSEEVAFMLSALNTQPDTGIEYLRKWLAQMCTLVSEAQKERSNSLVSAVCEYINTNYAQPIGLAEASRHVGRNASYISRLIRECTGKSFTQILTDKRMQEAKKLLKETNLKVNEVAERTGYMNVRYFTRIFKAAMNMSPSDYRSLSAAFL